MCVLLTFPLDLQRAEIFATERDLAFVQTSAKTGFNIDRLFHDIGKSHMSVLTAATCLTADPGVASSIPDRSHTFVEIDHELISTAILLPSAGSRRVAVSYKQKYEPVHEEMVNCLKSVTM